MSRVTKWVAAAVLAAIGLTAATGSASAAGPAAAYPYLPPNGNPGPFPQHGPRHDTDYAVYVKFGWHGHWRFHGRYETLHQAQRAERMLERDGYQARIQPVNGDHHRPW